MALFGGDSRRGKEARGGKERREEEGGDKWSHYTKKKCMHR